MSYGLEIYNSSGNLIVGTTSDLLALASNGTLTIPASGNIPVTVTGVTNTSQWVVLILSNNGGLVPLNTSVSASKTTDTVTFSNSNTSNAADIRYLIMRRG